MSLMTVLFLGCAHSAAKKGDLRSAKTEAQIHAIYEKLAKIILPTVDFEQAEIYQVVQALNQASKAHGFDIVFSPYPKELVPEFSYPQVTIHLKNASLEQVLQALRHDEYMYRILPSRIVLVQGCLLMVEVESRMYRINLGAFEREIRQEMGLADGAVVSNSLLKDYFLKVGVPLPPEASIYYERSRRRLFVTNSLAELDTVERVLAVINK